MSLTAAQLISGTDAIGSAPVVYHRINDLINNPMTSMADIGQVISEDPGLSVRLLRLVNSPYFGFPSKVDTISRAVVIVGTKQIRDLARAYSETKLPRFRHGCETGIEFLLEAQYGNGGWPQRFPDSRGYSRYITFNDDAMAGALTVLHEVANGVEPFGWADEKLRGRAAEAVERGVACILKCQIVVDGKRTVWGQQHDDVTFEPRPARAFEPVSLCSHESVGVIEFLMSLDAS